MQALVISWRSNRIIRVWSIFTSLKLLGKGNAIDGIRSHASLSLSWLVFKEIFAPLAFSGLLRVRAGFSFPPFR